MGSVVSAAAAVLKARTKEKMLDNKELEVFIHKEDKEMKKHEHVLHTEILSDCTDSSLNR